MGLLGWLSRRVLAWVLFAPLVAFWYVMIVVATRGNPPPIERVAGLAIVLAGISDWIIVRRVKKVMKRKKQRQQP